MEAPKKNIFLSNTIEPLPYVSRRTRGAEKRIPERDVNAHAAYLTRRFQEAYSQSLTQKQVAAIRYKEGTYLEFSSLKSHDLAVKSLENLNVGIRLLNVRIDEENDIARATVYVPDGKEAYFIGKVDKYLSTYNEKGKARYDELINSIEDVKLAFLDAFWIGAKTAIPVTTPAWCEIWLRVEKDDFKVVEDAFSKCCIDLKIPCDDRSIKFPERLIKLVFASAEQLSNVISNFSYVAEIRRAPELASFFEELTVKEQRDWANELLSRLDYDISNTAVCILDTGINSGHPLLLSAVDGEDTVQSVESSWGSDDKDGHGTEMAGVSLYKSLEEKLLSTSRYVVKHKIESVKILPSNEENEPQLYGAITQRAIYLAEISRPHTNRAICMAVTSEKYNTPDGSPTSWSGAVDSIVAGVNGENKRLFFVSAGNVHPLEIVDPQHYYNTNILHSVESPGQAWNAITVGAYNNLIRITNGLYANYQPVADAGQLSPYSSTSVSWNPKWPIKPEILCDGGNMVTDGTNVTECEDLSLLTTYFKPLSRLFTTTWGTSSATAQASYIAAQLMAEYPDAWPETIRALMIHSARWTDAMIRQFGQPDTKTKGRRNLLRSCGYGIPNLETALHCMNNSVNLVIEGELQPFEKDSMNEMHIHKIPWPEDLLRDLGEVQAEMRVTLSYFIEPGPGEIGWKDRYRYPSCGLRFDVINKNENKQDFIKRINVKMRGEDPQDKGEGTSGSEYWHLGSDNRDVGSVHSDSRLQNAADLCEARFIAIYPVIGWWRERGYLHRYNDNVRYSLVVSISTPGIEVDLYTPIVTEIQVSTTQTIEIEVPHRSDQS
ncbi:MAG: S8 family peptidase [Christensenellales bacterium]|jgi:hypothetical protein